MNLDIRPMTPADLRAALDWAGAEGWNPGIDDAAAFHAQDPSGFLMGWLGGERVGCISVVKYDEAFAFLGLYIVRPEFRGQGHGKAIWDAGIAGAAGRTIGLDGVPAQQHNYRRSGFELSHRNARWGGVPRGLPAIPSNVRAIHAEDLSIVETYDRLHFPGQRDAFLNTWLRPGLARWSLAWFADDGSVGGYGTIRRCRRGLKVGPLFADTPGIAEGLLAALLGSALEPIYIDIPQPNAPAAALAVKLGLTPEFETARMYLGPAPSLPLGRIFGLTTLELG